MPYHLLPLEQKIDKLIQTKHTRTLGENFISLKEEYFFLPIVVITVKKNYLLKTANYWRRFNDNCITIRLEMTNLVERFEQNSEYNMK